MASIPSFIFGGNSGVASPQEAARNRAVYEAMAARMRAPRDVGEGLSAIGQAIIGRTAMDRASTAEQEGQANAAKLFAGLQDGADQNELMGLMADPWVAQNPGMSAVAQTMMNRQMQSSDPAYQLEQEYKQAQLEALQNPQPDATSNMKNYEFLVGQGVDPQVAQERAFGGGGVKVDARNMGSIPPGFSVEYDDKGNPVRMAPIPGGPAEADMATAAAAAGAASEKEARTANIVVEDIGRALDLIQSNPTMTAGIGGQLTSGVGSTPAKDVAALLDTVKANAGFAELQAMRESSPTGGALGQVTERELALLQSTIGSLDQTQSPDQLKRNLERVREVYLDIIHGPGKRPDTAAKGEAASGAEVTATNPQTGETLVLRDGQWVKR